MSTNIMTKNTSETKCYMATIKYFEINEYDEEWLELCRKFFYTAGSHDEAYEMAEDYLDGIGFTEDEEIGWTDYRHVASIEVSSMDEENFWCDSNFSSDVVWKKDLLEWADSNPALAEQLWNIAMKRDEVGHPGIQALLAFRSNYEKQLLMAESMRQQHEETRAKSL